MTTSTLHRARQGLQRFAWDQSGGVAVIFGLSFVPLAFLSLVMVDYARASNARQGLQETLDAATLIAARSTAVEPDPLDAVGDKAFTAQIASNLSLQGLGADSNGRVAKVTFTPSGNAVTGVAQATFKPIVSKIFLTQDTNIKATSTVVRSVNKLEIALVLDTTGSMEGTKLSNLVTAAKQFVTTMESAASRSSEPNPVKIAIVPFSTTVKVSAPIQLHKVGSSVEYNTSTFSMTGLPTWLDGRARAFDWDKDIFTVASSTAARTDRFAMLKQMKINWGGCVEARKDPYDVQDTAPASGTVATLFTPFFWPDEPDTSSNFKNDYLTDGNSGTWKQRQGAVAKYNTTTLTATGTFSQGTGYGANLTYGPNAGCAMQQLQRLSTNFSALRTSIDGLVASGETNIPLGLMWGWHAISPNLPLADGVAYNTPKTTKIIVLMTDGDNTMNSSGNDNASWYHGYGYIWQNRLGTTSSDSSERTSKMNGRMSLLCANIRAKDIIVYTVGVGVSSTNKTLLQNCATTTGQYYDVSSDAGNLSAAFSAIAGSIENLRISK